MLGSKGEGGCVVWHRAEQRGRGTELESTADSYHLSCQAFHHSAQLENEEKTQVRISQSNPEAFHENKHGSHPLALASVSVSLCVSVCVCVLFDHFSLFPSLLLSLQMSFRT